MYYPVKSPEGDDIYPIGPTGYESCWRVEKKTYEKMCATDMIVWLKREDRWVPYVKYYLEGRTKQLSNLYNNIEGNKKGSLQLKELFNSKDIFTNPKPIEFINILLLSSCSKDSIILDFFSGSATTAHAVMSLNAEDGGKRKFIMVQLPEVCDEKSEAYKAGYKNICEIGKERIRRAGKKIVEETGKTDLDIGFKVLKLDSSNMKDIYYTPDELSQNDLIESISNIKDGRSGYDLLYQCLLDWGLELSLPHKTIKINNNEVHIVNDGDLIACFDANVSEDTIKQIANKKPMRVVFRDSSFATPAARINVDEIFKLKSPQTDIKVL
jgi:adenine-specific DNA-methyltransferase